MSETHENEVRDLIESVPSVSASASLRSRVEKLADFHAGNSRKRQMDAFRVRIAVLAGAAGLGVFAIFALSPSTVAARTLGKIQAAIDGARTMHFHQADITGKSVNNFDEWFEDGKWRMQRGNGDTTVWSNGTSYQYSAKTGVVIRKASDSPFSHGTPGFKMSSIISGLNPRGRTPVVVKTDLGSGTYRLVVDNPFVSERYTFTVDTKTDLPKTMEVSKPEAGGWVVKTKGTIDFNVAIDPKIFSPDFPTGAKVIDFDAYRAHLGEQFQKTVATLSAPKRRPTYIRNVQVNTQGHVFIAYSGPGSGSNGWFELTDETGAVYVQADLYNRGAFPGRELDLGTSGSYTFLWWIPLKEQPAAAPHRYTLKIREQKHIRLDKPGWFTPGPVIDVCSAQFAVPLPTTSDIPTYASAIGMQYLPTDELDVERTAAAIRFFSLSHVWRVDKGGNIEVPAGPGVTTYNRNTSGNRRDPESLRLAYEAAEREVELDERYAEINGPTSINGEGLSNLYTACRLLGKDQEAQQALESLKKISPETAQNAVRGIEYEKKMGNVPNEGKR